MSIRERYEHRGQRADLKVRNERMALLMEAGHHDRYIGEQVNLSPLTVRKYREHLKSEGRNIKDLPNKVKDTPDWRKL